MTTTSERRDRLMEIMPAPTDARPACPPCPTCGHPAEQTTVRICKTIATGSYLCPAGHLWQTRWVVGG